MSSVKSLVLEARALEDAKLKEAEDERAKEARKVAAKDTKAWLVCLHRIISLQHTNEQVAKVILSNKRITLHAQGLGFGAGL